MSRIWILAAILATVMASLMFTANAEYPADVEGRHRYAKKSVSSSDRQGEEFRLPRHVLPYLYEIQLLPFIEVDNFTTHGKIKIYVDCVEEADFITLNMADIVMDQSSIEVDEIHVNPHSLSVIDTMEDIVHETLTIHLGETLVKGAQYRISMKFVSVLNDQLRGFYRSSYVENGIEKYLAVSQMESTDARRAFPCFDEPNMKASFSVTLGRKKSMTSSSNMPLIDSTDIEGLPDYVWDRYQTSLKMSTYLVVLMVSEFVKSPAPPDLSNVEFNMWSRVIVQDQTKYALEKGPKVLEFFEGYYEIDFPLPKMDMASIPDFGSGAMENWGLMTFREELVLFDEKKSSAATKQLILEVISHELAHQWFGDLVTIDWWNVIWLNEGFARYMQYLGANSAEPSFQYFDQFILEVLHKVFATDALDSSRPLNAEVNDLDDIEQVFDTISYDKGGSVIRMLASFLGDETFRKGITRYLNAAAYSNAVQDDLWSALQAQADADGVKLPASVKEIMDSWTLKKNYPVITVSRDYCETNGATISQERFLLRKSESGSEDSTDYRWWVPLTYTSNFAGSSASVWISDKETQKPILISEATKNDWLIFNVDQLGYYRVKYDEINYGLILKQLTADHTKIKISNRAQLIEDGLNIARANLLDYSQVLDLTTYLVKEKDYIPWHASLKALTYVNDMLYSSETYGKWEGYMTSLIDPLYNSVGFEENENTDLLLEIYTRLDAIEWACKLGNTNCIQNSKEAYAKWMLDAESNELSPNQKRVITCTAIANGGQAEWDFAYNAYKTSEVNGEKSDLLSAMGCSKDPAILLKMLELMIDSTSGIRLQDAASVFNAVAVNPEGNRIAFEFLRDNFHDIEVYFDGYLSMGSFFKTVSLNYNTEEQLTEMIALLIAHPDALEGSAAVAQAIEIMEGNIEWMNLNYKEVADWLSNLEDSTMDLKSFQKMADEQQCVTLPPEGGSSNTIHQNISLLSLMVVFTSLVAKLV